MYASEKLQHQISNQNHDLFRPWGRRTGVGWMGPYKGADLDTQSTMGADSDTHSTKGADSDTHSTKGADSDTHSTKGADSDNARPRG